MNRASAREAMRRAMELQNSGQLPEAEKIYRKLLAELPDEPRVHFMLAKLCMQSGRFEKAIEYLNRVVKLKPDFPGVQLVLGLSYQRLGQLDRAKAALQDAVNLTPKDPAVWFHLAGALDDAGQLDESIQTYEHLLKMVPNLAQAYANFGVVLRRRGRMEDAIATFSKAVSNNPKLAGAYSNLGATLRDIGRLDEAAVACRKAIELQPDLAEAYTNLGNILREKGELDEAVSVCRRAVELKPDLAEARAHLANALRDQGHSAAAVEIYRAAVKLQPNNPTIRSALIFAMHFDPASTSAQILAESCRWAQIHEQPHVGSIPPHQNDRNPHRRLRIGYVSPDFRGHPIANFILPLFRHHHADQVEVFAYSGVRRPDEFTKQIRALTHQWRETVGLSDAELADVIRADRIDILVDLSLHTAENRLLTFARKPAPIQVTWLGYPGTTGLSRLDYRFTNPHLDPPGEGDAFHSEKSIRLPKTFYCYQPLIPSPEPNALPATSGAITFGSFNNFAKVNSQCIELWIKVLQAVDNSRLLIKCQPGSHVEQMCKRFADHKMSSDRLQILPRVPNAEYFSTFHKVDIALDAFPYGGHTTTFDAAWMGVPSITLRGRTAVGRGGVSILANLDMNDWIAETPQQYVDIARSKSSDLAALTSLRQNLRGRLQASPLMDGAAFADAVESAYRRTWETWCS